jgi:Activator of Hsp90 ATPase homolog 1-like protein
MDTLMQTQRSLPYSPDEIYAAFADPCRLAQWWGPNSFTNTFERFEFSVGGHWQFVMHGPDGTHYNNACVFKALEAGKQIVIEHIVAPYFTLTISLLAEPAGTKLIWQQNFADPNVAAAIRHIVEPSNEQNLDRLLLCLRGGA